MNKDEFYEEIKKRLLADNIKIVDVTRMDIIRNNETVRDSIAIVIADNSTTPIFDFDAIYTDYVRGMNTNEIAACITNRLESDENQNIMHFDSLEIRDYSKIKDRIIYRIVNLEKNHRWLTENCIVYCPYLDLAIVYYVMIYSDKKRVGSFAVNKTILDFWKKSSDFIDMNELSQVALRNSQRLFPMTVRNMAETICNILTKVVDEENRIDFEQFFKTNVEKDEPSVSIVSNKTGINGASVMLYPEFKTFMKDLIAECYVKWVYILPSSIHELLVIPATDDIDPRELKKIVGEVNREVLQSDEYLSDHVYQYSELAMMFAD